MAVQSLAALSSGILASCARGPGLSSQRSPDLHVRHAQQPCLLRDSDLHVCRDMGSVVSAWTQSGGKMATGFLEARPSNWSFSAKETYASRPLFLSVVGRRSMHRLTSVPVEGWGGRHGKEFFRRPMRFDKSAVV